MDNLRWILIIAGVAILILLYFNGRSRNSRTQSRPNRSTHHDNNDPLLMDDNTDDLLVDFDLSDPEDLARPGQQQVQTGSGAQQHPVSAMPLEPADYPLDDDLEPARPTHSLGFTSFAQKFEELSERLTPKRRQRVAASKPRDMDAVTPDDPEFANKIVTMHVVAPKETYFDGEELLDLFQARGYHFGEMDIFHSIHEGQIVFSIAKMIEPGYFDIEDINSFFTPGITMILQLPGPVQADVAFEALWEEAFEIANLLGGSVLDGDRNTLSKQTLQHMREGIYEYMHRQKYFGSVAS